MSVAPTIAMGVALGVSAMAASCDSRRGEIPNWLTLPPLVVAPLAYGFALGIEHALYSLAAAMLSASVPYLMFRRGSMGGGDVKVFGALGAITGFDLRAGLEIEVTALLVALLVACGRFAWNGTLLRTLVGAFRQALNPALPAGWRAEPCPRMATQIRMGGAIFVATVILAAPHVFAAWGLS